MLCTNLLVRLLEYVLNVDFEPDPVALKFQPDRDIINTRDRKHLVSS